mgnify:CR=1 FL=1
MGFTEAVKTCYVNSFTCKGRATRSEFWYFYLFGLISIILINSSIAMACVLIESNSHLIFIGPSYNFFVVMAAIFAIIYLTTIPASFCVGVRRLHDIGKSGYYWLIAFIPFGIIFLFCCYSFPSDDDNEYGQNPFSKQENRLPIYSSTQSKNFSSIPNNQVVPPSIPISYFVVANNEQIGPLYLQGIKKMLQDGKINRQTLIWKQGMSDWDMINNIQEFNY